MATIIKTNGQIENIEPENKKMFKLEELQKAVNGYIEILPIRSGEYAGKLMIVDEEGMLKAETLYNHTASLITGRRIVGQVIIIDRDQIE